MEQGHKSFAYFGLKGRGFSIGRGAGYLSELRSHGFQASFFKGFKSYPDPHVTPLVYVPHEFSFAGWIKSLPKPCAIFCCDDMRAEWVSLECRNLSLRVPDDISIVGVDDNEVHCLSAVPHLSSIRLPARQAGYEAAKVLDQILESGAKNKSAKILFPPEQVVCRESSDILAVENPQLVKALKFIRSNAPAGNLSVAAVVAQTSYCRRILESKFRSAFGRTIFQEIRRIQVEHAKKLLRETMDTMESIADASGWGSASHFGVEFKKITGFSPGDYRKKMR
jgi:LacI family transcriptional regulator